MSLKIERAIRSYVLQMVEDACKAHGRKPWFLQIGAHDGLTDDPVHALVKQHGWRGAFVEPVPAVFEQLRDNYAGIPDLRFIEAAVGDHDGAAPFFVGANTRKASLLEERAAPTGTSEAIEVRLVSVLALLSIADLPELDVLLVDAEGMDAVILQQFDFSQVRPFAVLYESHLLDPQAQAEIATHLRSHGYTVLQLYADSFAIRSDTISEPLAKLLQFAHNEYVALSAAKTAPALTGPVPTTSATTVKVTSATREPRGPCEDVASNELVNWYFAVNGPGLRKSFDLVRVAVTSAKLNTTLKPHCIYDGPPCSELSWLTDQGVTVIQHRPSLAPELKAAYGPKYEQFNGHWLRVDLPLIERKARWVLYTDIDVMFLRDPREFAFRPTYLAVCEEHAVGARSHFNSGSLVMHLATLRNVHPWFVASIKQRLSSSDFSFPAHDQRSFNDFFLATADWMRPEFNWKPYWGYNEEAVIVHFHGPKPAHVQKIKAGRGGEMKAAFTTIYNRNPDGYERYMQAFTRFLEQT